MAQAHAAQGGRDRLSLRALALAAALAQGCASLPPDVRHQAELGGVAVVAGTKAPEISFEGFRHGRVQGAALGAGSALLSCLGTSGIGCGGDAMCGVVLTFWAGVCAAGTAAGAVLATPASPSSAAESVRRSEADL
jgi:hypothetical protein